MGIDKYTLLPYVSEEDGELIREYGSEIGGPAVNTLILSLIARGHFVRVFTPASRSFVIRSEKVEIYAAKECRTPKIAGLWGVFITGHNLGRVVREHYQDLDIIHAHWTYHLAYATFPVVKKLPVACTVRDWAPYIWTIVPPLKQKITWTFRLALNELVFRNKDIHFIANSPYTQALVEKKLRKPIPVIPNSIKSIFIREEPHISPKTIRILCISSSFDKRKNLIALLKAFAIFIRKRPDATLQIICGTFTLDNPAVRKYEEQGLLKNVEMTGRVQHSELRRYIDEATMFVTPSLEETFGNTLLENMARRVPVVGGKNSGAVPYVLHHGEAGFLCDVSDPQSISDTMEYIVSHPSEVEAVVERAFEIIKSEYAQDVVCDKHIEEYKKIIEEYNTNRSKTSSIDNC